MVPKGGVSPRTGIGPAWYLSDGTWGHGIPREVARMPRHPNGRVHSVTLKVFIPPALEARVRAVLRCDTGESLSQLIRAALVREVESREAVGTKGGPGAQGGAR